MQAIGGGVSAAATDGNGNNASLLSTGNNLMIAGIAFQVATMGLAGILFVTFAVRYRKGKHGSRSPGDGSPEPKFVASREDREHRRTVFVYCAVVALAYLTVLIRCIYRYVSIFDALLLSQLFHYLVLIANLPVFPRWQVDGATLSCKMRRNS